MYEVHLQKYIMIYEAINRMPIELLIYFIVIISCKGYLIYLITAWYRSYNKSLDAQLEILRSTNKTYIRPIKEV